VPDTPKAVTVRSLEILGLEGAVARFRVACTSGTYIRSLAHDIGKVLGTGAHLGSLRRTTIGPFRLEEARTLPALEALPREERFGKPSWLSLSEIPLPFPAVALAPAEAAKVKSGHGVPVRVPEGASGAAMVRLTEGGELLALGILEPLGRGALALARPKVVLAG
jgi:tRNA pseudouridine55 synthase